MTILLSILKILGIILLCILGLLVLLILLLLFYPVSYRISGRTKEGQTALKVHGAWCLFLLRFSFRMEQGEQHAAARIFGIKIWEYPAVPKVKKKSHPKRKAHLSRKSKKKDFKEREKDFTKETLQLPEQKTEQEETEQKIVQKKAEQTEQKIAQKKIRKRESFRWLKKAGKKLKTVYNKIKAFPQKVRNAGKKLKQINQWIQDEQNRSAVRFAIGEVFGLLKKYGPKHLKADVVYGMEDPAATGQVLAALSILPFLYYDRVSIRPDFEAEKFYIEGNWDIRGRIQLIHLLKAAIRIWKNPDVKHLLKQF